MSFVQLQFFAAFPDRVIFKIHQIKTVKKRFLVIVHVSSTLINNNRNLITWKLINARLKHLLKLGALQDKLTLHPTFFIGWKTVPDQKSQGTSKVHIVVNFPKNLFHVIRNNLVFTSRLSVLNYKFYIENVHIKKKRFTQKIH